MANIDPLAALWGIPFIVIGQYMIWGRFLRDARLKRRTYYGLTNRHVLVGRNYQSLLTGAKRRAT